MRPKERRETGEHDLFRSRLDQIIDLEHALVKLARAIDWRFLEGKFGTAYSDKPGHPPLPTRLHDAFLRPLYLAERVLLQDRRQRGRKVYSLHAPEVECIGKGKAHRPYEFGVKVSVATPVKHSAGGQFVTHVA